MQSAAHDENVHHELSMSAFRSSYGLSAFLAETLGSECAPVQRSHILRTRAFDVPPDLPKTPNEWLAYGSYQEDMQDQPWPPFWNPRHFRRSCNHFYTVMPQRQPGDAPGLTDGTESWGQLPWPIVNSLIWATTPGMLSHTCRIHS